MKKNIKTRKSKLALDLSFNKNYKVRKLEGDDTTQTTTGEPPTTVENNDVKSVPFMPMGTISPSAFKYSDNAKKREQEKQQAIQDVLDLNLPRKYEKSKLERIEEKYKPDNYSYVDNYSTPAYEEYKKDLRINPTPFLSPSRKHFTNTGHTYTIQAPFQVKSHYTNRYTNWLFDWYTDPTTQKILKENNIKPSTWYWDDNTGKPVDVPEDEDIIDAIVGTLNVPVIRGGFTDLNGNIIEDLLGAARSYGSPNTDGAIFINGYGSPKDNTYIHEYTHSINNALGYKNNSSGSYEEAESEDYARLNELRHFLDLHPSKRDYTVEDAKNIINYLKTLDKEGKYHLSPYILDWSAEELQTMLNTWASNNLDNKSNRLAIPQQLNNNDYGIEQTDTITVAKNGGKLNNKYSGGGEMAEASAAVETPHKIGEIGHNDFNSQRKIINQFSVRDENGNLVLDEEGKAQLTPIGYVATQNSKEFGKYKKYRQSKGEEIPSKRDNVSNFLYDWFNAPATIDILKRENAGTEVFKPFTYTDENGNQVTYTPTAEEAVALRSFLADSVPEKYASAEDMGDLDGKYNYKNRAAAITPFGINLDSPVPTIKKVTNPNTGFEKQYYFGPEIKYKKGYDTDDVVLAEKVHAFQEQLMPYIFLGHNDLAYTKRPAEKHEKLMRIRAALGLDPNKRDYGFHDAKEIMSVIRKYENLEDKMWETEKSAPGSMSALFDAINNSASTFAHMLNTWPLTDDPRKKAREITRNMPDYDVSNDYFVDDSFKNGGKLNLNKYAGGGKMAANSAAVAKKAFSNGNGAATLAGLGSAAIGIAESAIANAEVDTSSATNAIEATQNHQLDTNSLDALAASYNTTPWASEDLNFKDFRPGAGELIMNTAKAGIQGLSAGGSAGGPWGAIAGAAVGLGSALGGMFAGRAKAKKEEARLENEAKLANMSLQAQAESNRDLIMQQQANSALRNLAAEGGQLDTYKEGEEYDLSAKEIKDLKSKGYDIDLGYNLNEEVDVDPSDIQTLRELGYEFDII
jgi:hypothetical protein